MLLTVDVVCSSRRWPGACSCKVARARRRPEDKGGGGDGEGGGGEGERGGGGEGATTQEKSAHLPLFNPKPMPAQSSFPALFGSPGFQLE